MKKLTAWFLLLSVYAGAIAPTAPAQIIGKAMDDRLKNVPTGLKFRLSEGVEGAEKREKAQLPSTDPLSDSDARNLLKRIPAIKPDKDDQTEFAKRVGSLPAPKTGKRIPVKFPSDEMRNPPNAGGSQTLEVVRHSPDGEVNLAPDLSVTFSQPMVAGVGWELKR
jgi:alpha-2-macroglobulin